MLISTTCRPRQTRKHKKSYHFTVLYTVVQFKQLCCKVRLVLINSFPVSIYVTTYPTLSDNVTNEVRKNNVKQAEDS
jgi:hypothetical protein